MPTIINRGLIDATMFPPSEFFIGDIRIINMAEIRVQGATPSVLHVGYVNHEAVMENEMNVTVRSGNTLIYHGESRDIQHGNNILDGGVLQCTIGSQQLRIAARTISDLVISGGDVFIFDIAGTLSVDVGGGELIFKGDAVNMSTLSITEGGVTIDGTLVVHDLIMNGGHVSGSGHMTIENSWVWQDGYIGKSHLASIDLYGPLVIRSESYKQLGRTLNLKKSSTWFAARSLIQLDQRLIVDEGVHIQVTGTYMAIYAATSSGSSVFQNKGSVTASLKDGGFSLQVAVENHGEINVIAGDLILSQFTHQSGRLSLESGTLFVHGGKVTVNENYFHMNGDKVHVSIKHIICIYTFIPIHPSLHSRIYYIDQTLQMGLKLL